MGARSAWPPDVPGSSPGRSAARVPPGFAPPTARVIALGPTEAGPLAARGRPSRCRARSDPKAGAASNPVERDGPVLEVIRRMSTANPLAPPPVGLGRDPRVDDAVDRRPRARLRLVLDPQGQSDRDAGLVAGNDRPTHPAPASRGDDPGAGMRLGHAHPSAGGGLPERSARSRRRPSTRGTTCPGYANSLQSTEGVRLSGFPGELAGRQFDYVIASNVLDQACAAPLLTEVQKLLKPGGRLLFFESNPWNPVLQMRRRLAAILPFLRRGDERKLHNRVQLYELLSELGYVSIATTCYDFLYPPVPRWSLPVMRTTLPGDGECSAGQATGRDDPRPCAEAPARPAQAVGEDDRAPRPARGASRSSCLATTRR